MKKRLRLWGRAFIFTQSSYKIKLSKFYLCGSFGFIFNLDPIISSTLTCPFFFLPRHAANGYSGKQDSDFKLFM